MEPIPDITWVTRNQRLAISETEGKIKHYSSKNKHDNNNKTSKQKHSNKMIPKDILL